MWSRGQACFFQKHLKYLNNVMAKQKCQLHKSAKGIQP